TAVLRFVVCLRALAAQKKVDQKAEGGISWPIPTLGFRRYAPMIEPIPPGCDCPSSVQEIRQRILQLVEEIIDYCSTCERSFFLFEKGLMTRLRPLGCLFMSLFLLTRHRRLN